MANISITTIQPPIYIPLLSNDGINLTSEWRQYFNSLTLFLQQFQNTIQVPSLTTDQIAALNPLINGMIVYNNSINVFQGYVNGLWKTFNLT